MFLFPYSLGLFLGIQIGKTINPSWQYLLYENRKVNSNYYKNNQIDYRYNK